MKKYLLVLCLALVSVVLIIVGLNLIAADNQQQADTTVIDGADVGSEAWCDGMLDVPGVQWTLVDKQVFSKRCLYE